MKVLIIEKNEIHPKAIELLKQNGFEIINNSDSEKQKRESQALIVKTYTRVTSQDLDALPNLKYILRTGVGLDNIDIDACREKNIKIFNSPASNSNAVSELVIMYMIMLARNVLSQMQDMQKGKWRNKDQIGEELKDKIIGIVGCGAIGQLVAKKLKNFEAENILGFDPYLDENILSEFGIVKTELSNLLKKSDFITFHLPLNDKTKNLISKKEIDLMKKNACIINTARGAIINEKDLISALKNRKIKGAALDVFENEPDINKEFLQLRNVITTPHIGAYTTSADEAMSVEAVKNFLNYLQNNN